MDDAPSRIQKDAAKRCPSASPLCYTDSKNNKNKKTESESIMLMTIPMTTAEIVLYLFMTGVLGVLAKFLSLILKPEDDGLLRAVPGILAFFALSAIILLYSTSHPAIATSCLITFMTGYSTVLMTARYTKA